MNKIEISIISPVYMAEPILDELVNRIVTEIKKITIHYEIILIEDGSKDQSWNKIESLAKTYEQLKGLKLSRNFGQHAAIVAGLEHAKGDYCIVMDCDLQDDPVYFKDLFSKIQEGYDTVFTVKESRKHNSFKNLTAWFYNKAFNFLSDQNDLYGSGKIGGYSMISRKVVEAFKNYNDYQLHYLLVLRWLGFRQGYIEIIHKERKEGKSSYSLKKLIEHSLISITYHSDKLLRSSIILGFILSFSGFLSGGVIIFLYFINGFQQGWPSLVVINLTLSGVVLLSIGITGLYVGKIFEQVKGRPRYIVDRNTIGN